ncbi:MAG: SRPBCC family protein [bacterium]|nr:SRPBCC family protein [bacterium]
MNSQSITQTILFDAAPHDVFEAIMDENIHSAFTGASAAIARKVGGKFSVWDGYASGVTKELTKDKKIVQTWRASDWPSAHHSTIVFEFYPVKRGTKLVFKQEGIPEDQIESISQGWYEFYWDPMKKYFGDRS